MPRTPDYTEGYADAIVDVRTAITITEQMLPKRGSGPARRLLEGLKESLKILEEIKTKGATYGQN